MNFFLGSCIEPQQSRGSARGLRPLVLVGLAIIVFIESGVLFPFLPGDSLLVTAAVLRAMSLTFMCGSLS